jgi:YegS/Rv2252/BmrU family lipid kinase
LNGLLLFVVNEKSGNGRGHKIWTKVEAQLRKKGLAYISIATRSQEDAVIRVKEHMQHTHLKAIVIIGGDGSLHGLLPLLAGNSIPYGLIPSGSGNDTSRALGIPRHPIRALNIILAGHTRAIDLLETRTEDGAAQFTLTAVAIGLDATVAEDVNGSRYKRWCSKLRLGSLAYIIGLFRALAQFKPRSITVTMDGAAQHFQRSWLCAIANVSTYGGGLKICPKAIPDDGQLHVCIVHNCSVWRILHLFPTLLNGSHIKLPYVTILSGKSVTIHSQDRMLAYGDGEYSGQTPLTATILPRQLLFLIDVSG